MQSPTSIQVDGWNNYERKWFDKFFPTLERRKSFRKLFTRKASSSSTGSCGKECFSYNYGPHYPTYYGNIPKDGKETKWILITKHKIDQAIRELEGKNMEK